MENVPRSETEYISRHVTTANLIVMVFLEIENYIAKMDNFSRFAVLQNS